MEILVLFLVGAALVVIVLPVVALIKAANAVHETEKLQRRIGYLETQIAELMRTRSAPPESTLEKLKAAREEASSAPKASAAPAVKPPPFVESPSAPPVEAVDQPEPEFANEPAPQQEWAPPVISPAYVARSEEGETFEAKLPEPEAEPSIARESSAPGKPFNLEQFMGVRLFAWLGGFALFLAAAFFVKYSFDHDLVSPAMRVTTGFVIGLGLVGGGLWMSRERYKITADTLCATGTVILYAVTFASHAVYKFPWFTVIPTFLLMSVITVAAFFIAVRANAMVVAVLGMLGGFLTPVLVNTGTDNPLALFTYVALLDIGLLAVASARRWDWLNLAGAIGTVLMLLAWVTGFFEPEKVFIAMAVFLGFCALYLAATAWAQRGRKLNNWLLAAALLPPAATFLFVLELINNPVTGARPGVLFAFLFGADVVVLALSALRVLKPASTNSNETDSPGNAGLEERDSSSLAANLGWLAQVVGGGVFLLLAIWTAWCVDEALLFWALGGYLGFALLHTAFPLVLQRRFPGEPTPMWTQIFPVLSLLLTLIPIFKFESVSFLIWPVILLINLVAFGLALVTLSVVGILFALVVTAGVGLFWLLQLPAELSGLPEMLLVIGGMAAVFTAAGVFLGRVIVARNPSGEVADGSGFLPAGWSPAEVQRQIPALSAVLPFLLLVVVTTRLPLASPAPVFGLALGLVVLLLGLTRMFSLSWLPAIGLGCVFLVEYGWHFRHFSTAAAVPALAWYLVFFAAFLLYPFLFHRRDGSKVIAWIASAASGPVHFLLVYHLVRGAWPNEFMGLVPALFVLPALGGLIAVWNQIPIAHPKRNTVLAWFGGVTLLFVTLIFPIQFEREWLTVAWALEGAALLWLFHRVPHPGLRYVGVALLVVTFVRLGLNPAVLGYHPRGLTPMHNWYMYTYGLAIAAMFVGARFLRPPDHRVFGKDARPLLITLGVILAFLLLNIQIANHFTAPGEPRLVFSFRGNFARDVAYTIGWALFAFVLLVVGLIVRVRPARWAGIGLLAVTLLKLFFHDLATLNQLYRVGALMGVAVIAIVASFLYQKFLR